MSLNPIIALNHVIEEYRDYLRSEFRARDRQLRCDLETELDRPLFLAQEPFYQAHRPFQNGRSWARLPLDPALSRAIAVRSRSENAFLHQSESIDHLLGASATPLVVTTGTGSGKSECFLLPVIQNAINDARLFRRTGLTAILVYPMNALANDQEKRIKDYLDAAGVSDIVDVKKYDRGTDQAERERMRANPPRILLTNYVMLEYLLIRPADRDAIFANHRCRFLVLDEVHTYRGVLGSNIGLLLRRLRAHLARARQDWSTDVSEEQRTARFPRLISVGTSATIKSEADGSFSPEERRRQRDVAVQDFFHRVTGEPANQIRVIAEVLENLEVPSVATFSPAVPQFNEPLDITNARAVENALATSAGITPTGNLTATARHCRLLWLLNQWLVARPMSCEQVVSRVSSEIPQRQDADRAALKREIETILLAGSALPENIPGSLRLRAHRLIRGGWKFVRCIDPDCRRIYPLAQPMCSCGRATAPLLLCRRCGADYLALSGEPTRGQMQIPGDNSEGNEWLLYDLNRQDTAVTGDDDENETEVPAPGGRRPRIERIRGEQVYTGCFDPRTLSFSQTPGDFPLQVRLVPGRSRCVCCGGTAASRNIITRLALGTSAAIKVLGEGLVEALADANATRDGHDGKERLLIFSDSRQDAAHQARFIIFASRYDRMRRRLFALLQRNPAISIQRAVELLGEMGVQARDNHVARDLDPARALTREERQRVQAWEEAPLLDEISVAAQFPGTLVNLGLLSVRYEGLAEGVEQFGAPLCQAWGITTAQLTHLLRCFLDEVRLRGCLSREMLRYHPKYTACPDYISFADWERKVQSPQGLPADSEGRPLPHTDLNAVPYGIAVRNVWRAAGRGGRGPKFQQVVTHLLNRFGSRQASEADISLLLRFVWDRRCLDAYDTFGHRDRVRICQLNADIVQLYIPAETERFQCNVCSWPMSGSYAGAPCPRCHGSAVTWPDSEVNVHRTVRRLRQSTYRPLVADEHTAQVTNEKRIDLEKRFKASADEAALNVLACSPTMEMGIDVGGLDAVVLRNVPRRPDNYAQRGGRAGRRTRVGLVVGYARSTPHDQYFYDHPEEMISGEIPAPSISLANRDVTLRHLAAIAFGAAEPGLAGRMVEYVDEQGQIKADAAAQLTTAVVSQTNYAVELAQAAWGDEVLNEANLNVEALRAFLETLPARIADVLQRTALQVQELRGALERFNETLRGRHSGVRSATLVLRLLGLSSSDRDNRRDANDSSAGYPPRRFAEFGILPGYEFPSEPASLRLLGDVNEESPITVTRRLGIYQFMPEAPVYARSKRWKVHGLDPSSPWNPRSDAPWSYRVCRRCHLRYSTDHSTCPRCSLAEPGQAFLAYEFGGFLALRNEAPVLDEEDRVPARALIAFYPQWDGDVFQRWAVGPDWRLVLSRNEEVRWLNEGGEPSRAQQENGLVLHEEARGFCLCSACGRQLTQPPEQATGRRRARGGEERDPYGHARSCAQAGQPPRPAGIVTSISAEVLRLIAFLPEGIEPETIQQWTHSLGSALLTGMQHHLLLDGSEIEFEPEGPWQEAEDVGSLQRVALTFVDASVGGSGYIPRIARDFHLVARRALEHLNHPNCETACYRCLKSYSNQRNHDKLRWPIIIGDLDQLAETAPEQLALERGDIRDPQPWIEAFAAGVGSPLELRFLRMFEQHGFTPERQVPVAPNEGGMPISIADFAVPNVRLAIYIDGAAFHVGARLRRDRIIRQRLREGTLRWDVVELRARDLARGQSLVDELRRRGTSPST
jgi:ATP-dependent helicase YprA (DUF1998 family)